ncbi:MAG: hypothetical protein OXQ31_14325 [Spirochaetaceae bacterium]|nr:hypothetical protein [Spirochaetaceae bacterium]
MKKVSTALILAVAVVFCAAATERHRIDHATCGAVSTESTRLLIVLLAMCEELDEESMFRAVFTVGTNLGMVLGPELEEAAKTTFPDLILNMNSAVATGWRELSGGEDTTMVAFFIGSKRISHVWVREDGSTEVHWDGLPDETEEDG